MSKQDEVQRFERLSDFKQPDVDSLLGRLSDLQLELEDAAGAERAMLISQEWQAAVLRYHTLRLGCFAEIIKAAKDNGFEGQTTKDLLEWILPRITLKPLESTRLGSPAKFKWEPGDPLSVGMIPLVPPNSKKD